MREQKIIKTFMFFLMGVIFLTGCTSSKDVNFKEVSKSKDSSIFYLTKQENKESEIDSKSSVDFIVATKNGKACVYNMSLSEVTLKDLDGKDIEEVIELGATEDLRKFESTKNEEITRYSNIIDSAEELIKKEESFEFKNTKKIEDLQTQLKLLEKDLNELNGIKYEKPKSFNIEENTIFKYSYLETPLWDLNTFGEIHSEGDIKYEYLDLTYDFLDSKEAIKIGKNFYGTLNDPEKEMFLVSKVANEKSKLVLK